MLPPHSNGVLEKFGRNRSKQRWRDFEKSRQLLFFTSVLGRGGLAVARLLAWINGGVIWDRIKGGIFAQAKTLVDNGAPA